MVVPDHVRIPLTSYPMASPPRPTGPRSEQPIDFAVPDEFSAPMCHATSALLVRAFKQCDGTNECASEATRRHIIPMVHLRQNGNLPPTSSRHLLVITKFPQIN